MPRHSGIFDINQRPPIRRSGGFCLLARRGMATVGVPTKSKISGHDLLRCTCPLSGGKAYMARQLGFDRIELIVAESKARPVMTA